jgi:hypothetical protein
MPHRENDLLKKQLTALGYKVPKTEWSMKSRVGDDKRKDIKMTVDGGQDNIPSRLSRGAQYHSSSSRTLTGDADFGQANANNGLSSSSRKRTHGEYADQHAEVLPDAPAAHDREIGDLMLPPQILPQQYGERVSHQQYVSKSSSQSHPRSHREETQPNRRFNPEVQAYADDRWFTQPIVGAQLQRSASRDGSQYRMSGALYTNKRDRHQAEDSHQDMQQSNQNRLYYPQPPPSPEIPLPQFIRRPNSIHRQHVSTEFGHGRGIALAPMDERYSAPHATESCQPLRTVTRASAMREPLMVPLASRANEYPTDSAYFSNNELRAQHRPNDEYSFFNPTTPTPQRQRQDPISIAPIVRESPFFRRFSSLEDYQIPMRQRGMQVQPERLVSSARNFHMQPASPIEVRQMGRSLNALSFINSPFTNMNQPIYDRDDLPYTFRNGHHEHRYSTRLKQPHFQPPQARVRPIRPSSTIPARRTFTRDDDMKLLGAIRGAKSGNVGVYPGVAPFSKNRGNFSSAGVGRSSVR